MRSLSALLAVGSVFAGGMPAQEKKPADGPQPAAMVQNESVESPLTYIEVDGRRWDVYPNTVSRDFQAAQPFSYIQPVKLAVPNGKVYDDATGAVRFDLLLPKPTAEQTLSAAERVLNGFSAEQRRLVAAANVNLNGAPLVGYEVRLAVGGRRVVVDRVDTVSAGTDRLHVEVPVPDEQVRAELRRGAGANVEFYGLYKFRQSQTDEVRVTHTVAATSSAFEEVFGKPADPTYYVTRKVLDRLAISLKQTIRGEFIVGDSNRIPDLQQRAKRSLDLFQPVSVEELRKAAASLIAFGPDELRAELKPWRIANLIEKDTTYEKLYGTMERSWDKLYEELNNFKDEFEFFEKVCDYIETEKKGGGSAGGSFVFKFIPVKVDAGGSESFWKKEGRDKFTEGKRVQVREYMKRMREVYAAKDTHYKEFFRELTGRMATDGTLVKSLDVYRVDQASLVQSLTDEFRIVVNKGVITRPLLTTLALAGNDYLTDQQRFEALLARSDAFRGRFLDLLAQSQHSVIETGEWNPSVASTRPNEWERFRAFTEGNGAGQDGILKFKSDPIRFKKKFNSPPFVLLSLAQVEDVAKSPDAFYLVGREVTRTDEFTFYVHTGRATRFKDVHLSWIAVGE